MATRDSYDDEDISEAEGSYAWANDDDEAITGGVQCVHSLPILLEEGFTTGSERYVSLSAAQLLQHMQRAALGE